MHSKKKGNATLVQAVDSAGSMDNYMYGRYTLLLLCVLLMSSIAQYTHFFSVLKVFVLGA